MKKVFAVSQVIGLLMAVSFASQAKADANNYDGCYQIYMPGAAYNVICVQGTAEEGIAGSGARLAVLDAFGKAVDRCMKSSGIKITADSFVFESKGVAEFVMKNVKIADGLKEGDLISGKDQVLFRQISNKTSERFMKLANDKCN